MKKLNKFLFCIIIFIIFLFINSTIVSAETINVRNNLKKGSRGEQVKLLQTELNSVLGCNLDVDGSFGSKTLAAVKEFQTKYDLKVDGIAGASTIGKLNVNYLADKNYVIIYVSPTTNSGELNVREKATASSTKLGTIPSGEVYEYYDTKVTNGKTWYKIKYNGQDAYISGSYAKTTGILLDLSEQLLKVYNDGKLQMEFPVITGNNGNNNTVSHKTPTGKYLFYKTNKKTAVTLRGNNDDGSRYKSYVDYWMPFITNRGIGFHDASWRSSSQFYNINTYLSNGSHGCVNMRPADAKELFNFITSNIYVYVIE